MSETTPGVDVRVVRKGTGPTSTDWIEKMLGAPRPRGIMYDDRVDVKFSSDEIQVGQDPSRVRDWRAVTHWRIHVPGSEPVAAPPQAEERGRAAPEPTREKQPARRDDSELIRALEDRVANLRQALTNISSATNQGNIRQYVGETLIADLVASQRNSGR